MLAEHGQTALTIAATEEAILADLLVRDRDNWLLNDYAKKYGMI